MNFPLPHVKTKQKRAPIKKSSKSSKIKLPVIKSRKNSSRSRRSIPRQGYIPNTARNSNNNRIDIHHVNNASSHYIKVAN